MKCYLNFFRLIASLLPQLTLLYFIAGSRDLLWGFNQTSEGFTTMLVLLAVAPLLCLAWMIFETRYALKGFRQKKTLPLILGPLVAMFFVVESMMVDLYIVSHFRM